MIDLMGYSVLVDNEGQARELQKIALKQGFEWLFRCKKIKHLNVKSFQFGCDGERVISVNSSGEHFQNAYITKKAHFNDLFGAKFTPIAMKCTQEQFNAIRPKLNKNIEIQYTHFGDFSVFSYLTNCFKGEKNNITNIQIDLGNYNRKIYQEWNEETFLKACGIETETLEQQLEKAKAEVERLEKEIEDSRIKVGDWGKFWDTKGDFVIGKFERNVFGIYIVSGKTFLNCEKITDPKLIELLESGIK